ncbi:DUF305 domain-containing protein [Patescibacteria group bacterium]|nr:DUF305 domain-containing protein [Patescibacteria group bacterium]
MQNNKTVLSTIAALIIGLVVGYLVWGNTQTPKNTQGAHMMPDGTMMNNDGSDMSSMMMDMNAALRGKTGDAFDQVFLSEMIVHHQGAIDMAELALTDAKHQEIKDLAKAIVSAQTKEISEMKAWQKSWYNQ